MINIGNNLSSKGALGAIIGEDGNPVSGKYQKLSTGSARNRKIYSLFLQHFQTEQSQLELLAMVGTLGPRVSEFIRPLPKEIPSGHQLAHFSVDPYRGRETNPKTEAGDTDLEDDTLPGRYLDLPKNAEFVIYDTEEEGDLFAKITNEGGSSKVSAKKISRKEEKERVV